MASSNSAALARFRAKLETLDRDLKKRIFDRVAEGLRAQIATQFSTSVDINGRPWAPTIDGSKPLASVASTVTVQQIGQEIVVRVTHPKAIFLQGGWRIKNPKDGRAKTIARPIIPSRNRVGRSWIKAIREAAERALKELTSEAAK